jgi:uncharacterized delta-60 repeat protein
MVVGGHDVNRPGFAGGHQIQGGSALLIALGAPASAAAGDLDPTFGVGGTVTVSDLTIFAMALQPDGKIVVAGVSVDVFGLARLNPDGSLDASFGTGGLVTTDFGAAFEAAYAVALLPDGRIVAAGTAGESGRTRELALARYNPDGSLDASYDSDGRVINKVRRRGPRCQRRPGAARRQDRGRRVCRSRRRVQPRIRVGPLQHRRQPRRELRL